MTTRFPDDYIQDTNQHFAKRFSSLRKRDYRKVKDFRDAFQDAFDVDFEVKTIRNWEQGICVPNVYTIIKLCDFFHCDLDYLFCRIDTTTHAIEVIEKETGLSVPAIKKIIEWNNGDSRQKKWISYISKIFEHTNISDIMNNMSDYFMYSMIEVKSLVGVTFVKSQQNAIDAIDMQTASLWKLQHDFTKIVEELGSKYRKQILNKEKQKSRR